MVVSPIGWLTDKVITAAQMLLLQHFPNMLGLQPPTLQEVVGFQVDCEHDLQLSSKVGSQVMDVEKQSNRSDCGVLGIAYAFSGFDPCQVSFDHRTIQHLITCLERCQFSRFPVFGEPKSAAGKSSKTIDLHCSCCMPEQPGDEMAECDKCQVWYYCHCMDIPSEVFGDVEVSWKCKACCDSA